MALVGDRPTACDARERGGAHLVYATMATLRSAVNVIPEPSSLAPRHKVMKRTLLLASTALATAALTTTSFAQSGNDGPRTAPPTLTRVKWHAHTITVDGVTHLVPNGSRAGLMFNDDKRTFTGHDGCNTIWGKARVDVDESAITFGSKYASTLIACYRPDQVDLPPTGTYEARVTARTLTLTGPDCHVITLRR
ncbi:META domain-containing protein [Streptomyces sp. NPDC001652]|uniref:META domain-containing protein n=1 Tax=Streptomyces sp. NPDC001652 TaxID=3154393 RepID=UPI0033273AE1